MDTLQDRATDTNPKKDRKTNKDALFNTVAPRAKANIPVAPDQSPCEVGDAILAFAPDLELLNMERFLQDPAERSEIFRTELEALRQVLIVFQAEL
ncbi:hypothetical protein BGZ80_008356 [Entomortierella chlamydospora]|uniref:Uncharacterized protein n=1 Tax=Entomortierella chlamydospora TaxID=101097 RepID=A0A9P6N3D2_9FUNG|nr:hypothetical protein BGZ80_008356 [Entomortierella chlamydospora]